MANTTPPAPPQFATPELVLNALEDLGLTQTEHTVFTCLLRLGSRQASAIAKQTSISRAHVYEVLDRLTQRGLVSVHERDGVKHFSALSLEELLLVLQRKESALAERRKQLGEMVLSIKRPEAGLYSDPQTKSYRGAEARARLFQELVRDCEDGGIIFCSSTKSFLFDGHAPTEELLTKMLQAIPTQLQIILFSEGPAAQDLARRLGSTQVSAYAKELPAEMIIYGNRVTLIGEKMNAPNAITVDQPALFQCLRLLGESIIRELGIGNEQLSTAA